MVNKIYSSLIWIWHNGDDWKAILQMEGYVQTMKEGDNDPAKQLQGHQIKPLRTLLGCYCNYTKILQT